MSTVRELAQEAHDQLETASRPDGTGFVRARDGAPDWVRELAQEAHDGMIPDDYRYQAIRDALAFIADNDDDDGQFEFADSHTDEYTSDLVRWLGSHVDRPGYCDEAADLYGIADDRGIVDRIKLGQYQELAEVFWLVRQELEKLAGELDEADE